MQEFEVAPLNFMIFTILHSASHSLHWDASTRHYAPILTWLQQSSSPDMLDWCLMSRCQLFATVSCRYVCIHKNMKQNFIVKVSISKWSLKLTELSKEAQFTRQLREGFKIFFFTFGLKCEYMQRNLFHFIWQPPLLLPEPGKQHSIQVQLRKGPRGCHKGEKYNFLENSQ